MSNNRNIEDKASPLSVEGKPTEYLNSAANGKEENMRASSQHAQKAVEVQDKNHAEDWLDAQRVAFELAMGNRDSTRGN